MALASMTGFSRIDGAEERQNPVNWTWELRSVNGKGLDVRVRLPAGMEALEQYIREQAGAKLKRGNVTIGLSFQRGAREAFLQINEPALEAVLSAMQVIHRRLPDAAPPTLDGVLAYKGVLELKEPEENELEREALYEALKESFNSALSGLIEMRLSEGAALEALLSEQLNAIEKNIQIAENLPSSSIAAIREKLRRQVALLMDNADGLDPDRLHQEAAILATKADIREELDRLAAHVEAARALLTTGGPVGRRLDFLAQEFNREANTLCSKSNASELTTIGLELKTLIDQMREQVQNLE